MREAGFYWVMEHEGKPEDERDPKIEVMGERLVPPKDMSVEIAEDMARHWTTVYCGESRRREMYLNGSWECLEPEDEDL